MDIMRESAVKLSLDEVEEGKFFKSQGEMKPNFMITKSYFRAARVNVWGNVVSKRTNDEETFGVLELDDFTGVASAYFYQENIEKMKKFEVGDRAEIIGKIRESNDGKIFVMAEIINKINCNKEIVKRLENLKMKKILKKVKGDEFEGIVKERKETDEKKDFELASEKIDLSKTSE